MEPIEAVVNTDKKTLDTGRVKVKIMQWQLLSYCSSALIGLGMYGVFVVAESTEPAAFLSLLNNVQNAYGMIGIGIVLEVVILAKLIPLWKRRAALTKRQAK